MGNELAGGVGIGMKVRLNHGISPRRKAKKSPSAWRKPLGLRGNQPIIKGENTAG